MAIGFLELFIFWVCCVPRAHGECKCKGGCANAAAASADRAVAEAQVVEIKDMERGV